jgi:4-amino-4-deoxy-L-arabinose transferase-like glycosyltransferase
VNSRAQFRDDHVANTIAGRGQKGKAGRWILLSIFALALVLRLVDGIFVVGLDAPRGMDSRQYIQYAENLVSGRGYVLDDFHVLEQVHSVRMPGYPIFLAAFRYVFGPNLAWVRAAQCILGAVLALEVYWIAVVLFGVPVARIAAFATAIYPNFIRWSNLIATETLFLLLFVGAVGALFRHAETRKSVYLLAAGGALGLATLTRATAFPLFFLLVLYFLARYRPSMDGFKAWLIFAIAGLVVILPWSIRNMRIHGTFVLLSTQSGLSLWRAVGPGADPTGNDRFAPTPPIPCTIRTEVAWDKYLRDSAVREIRRRPMGFLRNLPAQFVRMWHLTPHFWLRKTAGGKLEELVFLSFYYPLLALSAGGIYLTRRSWRRLLPCHLAFVNFTAIHVVFVTAGRYRLPIIPFFVIFAAVMIICLLRRRRDVASGIASQREATQVMNVCSSRG